MGNKAIAIGAVGLMLGLPGCKTLEQTIRPDADKIAAFPLTHRAEVERIDLAQLIVDEAGLRDCKMADRNLAMLDENANVNFAGRRTDEALGCFNTFARQVSYAATTRNQIQERLLAASEQRCADFKALLQRKQSDTNFFTGLATAAFAAAGSITTSVEGARTLAGLSGLSSAYGAEYNQAYFSNLAAHVIVSGIDLHRSRIYEQITNQGQAKSIDAYPLQAAVKDAFRFHAACSITTGLVQAQEAIKTVENPGLGILQRATIKNKFLQALNKAEPVDVPATLSAWKDIVQSDTWLAGVPVVHTTSQVSFDAARLVNQTQEILASAPGANSALVTYGENVATGRKDAKLVDASTAAIKAATGKFKVLSASLVEVVTACTGAASKLADEHMLLAAKIRAAPDAKVREKMAVDLKYVNQAMDMVSVELTSRLIDVSSCDREMRFALRGIADAPKDDEDKIKKANDVLDGKTAKCPTKVDALPACKQ
jgi:hypothetical protein